MARSLRTERLVAVLLFVLSAPATADPDPANVGLAFARRGAPVADHDLDWLRQAVPASSVRVLEPYENRELAFTALPLEAVLDAVYGDDWRGEEEVLFTCRDGYQPTVPVQRVLDHRAWLAFARAAQSGFTLRKRESGEIKTIELGPFYLVWENLDDEKLRQEADYGWPYQLVGVDLIRARDRFPNLTPPADASPRVLAGFRAYRVHCSKCHELFGEGGSIGPALNAAANPLQYRDRDWLRSWIEDPARIQPNARMPALNPALPDRARTVDEILAYLDAMLVAR